jgi:outer membrane protein OmpA-like peptidoglycan-associated protein
MASRRTPIAILVAVVVLVTGCGTKAAKKAEPEPPPPTASAPPAEPPPVQEQRPPAEPPAPAPKPTPASPRAPQPAPAKSGPPQSIDEFVDEPALQDVFFEAGRFDIGPSRARFMKENARWIVENPDYFILIEGHTDAKGTPESRLAIADRRAKAAARFLLEEGVANTRLWTISHGSDRPTCVEATDLCAARNRRVHFRVRKL